MQMIKNFCLFLFSLTFLVVTLELSLAVLAYFYQPVEVAIPNSNVKNEFRILCLGESTTAWGYGNSYPKFLERKLQAKLPHFKINVINAGVSGTNTSQILDNLPHNLDLYRPHLVLTMMGINDKWALKNWNPVINIFRKLSPRVRLAKLLYYLFVNLHYKNQVDLDYRNSFELKTEQKSILAELEKKYMDSPKDHIYFLKKGEVYLNLGLFESAIFWTKKALLRSDKNLDIDSYKILGLAYLHKGDHHLAQMYLDQFFKKVKRPDVMIDLLKYLSIGLSPFSKSIMIKWRDQIQLHGPTNSQRQEINTIVRGYDQSPSFEGKSSTSPVFTLPQTTKNYIEIISLLKLRKIPVVILNYPNLPTSKMKRKLSSFQNLHIVANEDPFQHYMKEGHFTDLFVDRFGGMTGHYTALGAALLADNVAKYLIQNKLIMMP